MPKISDRFQSSYLKTDDVDRKGLELTITDVTEEEIVRGEEKLVLYFEELDKGLPLNKTNATTLAEDLGDDTDDWRGAKVLLRREKTIYQGKKLDCLRVHAQGKSGAAAAAAAAAR